MIGVCAVPAWFDKITVNSTAMVLLALAGVTAASVISSTPSELCGMVLSSGIVTVVEPLAVEEFQRGFMTADPAVPFDAAVTLPFESTVIEATV